MNRLNLDAFKAQANETHELEGLTGGILGACHCTWESSAPAGSTFSNIATTIHLLICDKDHGIGDQ